MTIVILAKDEKNNIWMAADGLTTQTDNYITNTKKEKIICLDEKYCFYVGCSGNMVGIELIKTFYKNKVSKKFKPSLYEPYDYLFEIFMPEFKDFLEKNDYTWVNSNECTCMYSTNYIASLYGKNFILSDEFDVMKIFKDFEAIGSGDKYAAGILNFYKNGKYIIPNTPNFHRFLEAVLEAVCDSNSHCGGKFKILKVWDINDSNNPII